MGLADLHQHGPPAPCTDRALACFWTSGGNPDDKGAVQSRTICLGAVRFTHFRTWGAACRERRVLRRTSAWRRWQEVPKILRSPRSKGGSENEDSPRSYAYILASSADSGCLERWRRDCQIVKLLRSRPAARAILSSLESARAAVLRGPSGRPMFPNLDSLRRSCRLEKSLPD
ncbi:hypothetical protein BV25DRAFT_626140 [Artomyces pyxidatus]|uniref:Uncharacterized protein n=1 Tax=Artomyces pyxidatus TaxID=48021 RepID=A0ACB8T203_9AGAM|nr:hypothetical protein BV25DRAFT_626140 [Artomyces pyxidatus]